MRASAKYIWIIIVVLFVGGFLLAQTSGLLGRAPVTNTTAAATVNGEDILATTWYQATQNLEQDETQRSNQSISLDERQRLMDQAYDQLVSDALLRQEYRRRGITVTDDEILQAARYSPPPQLMQAPDLQTDGQFDPAKYQRFLASPLAKQNGLLFQLEQYYRTEIRRKSSSTRSRATCTSRTSSCGAASRTRMTPHKCPSWCSNPSAFPTPPFA
jgi:peptidyl-prolyl cis-trans isomerase D